MSISVRFYHNAGDVNDNETVLVGIDPYSTTCKELIRKFCMESRTSFEECQSTENIAFLYNSKALNSKEFMNKLLSEIKILKSGKKIQVKDMKHLIGQKHIYI